MNTYSDFHPSWVSNPADTIRGLLSKKGLEEEDLPSLLGSSEDFISQLLRGSLEIDQDIAESLSLKLGFNSRFWINRFDKYHSDLRKLESKRKDSWLKSLPISDMLKFGWINNSGNLYDDCLRYFGCNSIIEWEGLYKKSLKQFAFRASGKFSSRFESTTVWLRKGEIVASNRKGNSWNPDLLLEKLDDLKKLTRIRDPKIFLPRLNEICLKCGVILVVAPTPKGCSMSGATKKIDESKRMILLSFRYLSDDQFWFTFFHEVGHLILHEDVKIFVDDKCEETSTYEKEANNFAGEVLIPFERRNDLYTLRRNKREIVALALELGISPGILIGQMQHYNIIAPSYLNGYKRRFNWEDIAKAL